MAEQRLTPVNMGVEELVKILDDMRERITHGDSFEGSIEYLMPADDDAPAQSFDVQATYRIGNTMGQGGVRMIGNWHDAPPRQRIDPGLILEVRNLTTSKGWRTEDSGKREGHEFAAYVALGHSEFSEALEAFRDKVWSETCEATEWGMDHSPACSGKPHKHPKPVGVGPELADVLIRVLDMADIWGQDINGEVERVLKYGWTRSYKHGGRQL